MTWDDDLGDYDFRPFLDEDEEEDRFLESDQEDFVA